MKLLKNLIVFNRPYASSVKESSLCFVIATAKKRASDEKEFHLKPRTSTT